MDSVIETGVDKLVALVNKNGRISSYDAVKELGVSNTVVMEWADYLEEEGIISIEYKFTKPFLVARKIAKKDLQEKAKEFSGNPGGGAGRGPLTNQIRRSAASTTTSNPRLSCSRRRNSR